MILIRVLLYQGFTSKKAWSSSQTSSKRRVLIPSGLLIVLPCIGSLIHVTIVPLSFTALISPEECTIQSVTRGGKYVIIVWLQRDKEKRRKSSGLEFMLQIVMKSTIPKPLKREREQVGHSTRRCAPSSSSWLITQRTWQFLSEVFCSHADDHRHSARLIVWVENRDDLQQVFC